MMMMMIARHKVDDIKTTTKRRIIKKLGAHTMAEVDYIVIKKNLPTPHVLQPPPPPSSDNTTK